MDHNKPNPSRLEMLPQDILDLIVANVAAESPVDYINTVLSCKELGLTGEDERVLQKLSLEPLKRQPLMAPDYGQLMTKWLANDNRDDHYIKGVLFYFQHGLKLTGLKHLRKAADAGNYEAIYLYAIIKIGTGKMEKGKKYFRMLKVEDDVTIAVSTWIKVRETLEELMIVPDVSYYAVLPKLVINMTCDLSAVDIVCPKCFYYKAMFKFIVET